MTVGKVLGVGDRHIPGHPLVEAPEDDFREPRGRGGGPAMDAIGEPERRKEPLEREAG